MPFGPRCLIGSCTVGIVTLFLFTNLMFLYKEFTVRKIRSFDMDLHSFFLLHAYGFIFSLLLRKSWSFFSPPYCFFTKNLLYHKIRRFGMAELMDFSLFRSSFCNAISNLALIALALLLRLFSIQFKHFNLSLNSWPKIVLYRFCYTVL